MTKPWTVLVIEDEPKIRQFIQGALESRYDVHLAGDGREGLHQARVIHPDVILLDLRMPGMDGLAVLARLKADLTTSGIPVIIVSAKGETDSLLEGQRAGATDYLIKPFRLEDLSGVVQRQIALRGG